MLERGEDAGQSKEESLDGKKPVFIVTADDQRPAEVLRFMLNQIGLDLKRGLVQNQSAGLAGCRTCLANGRLPGRCGLTDISTARCRERLTTGRTITSEVPAALTVPRAPCR